MSERCNPECEFYVLCALKARFDEAYPGAMDLHLDETADQLAQLAEACQTEPGDVMNCKILAQLQLAIRFKSTIPEQPTG